MLTLIGEQRAKALSWGLDRMQHYGGAKSGHRTMIDALHPAFEALLAGKKLSLVATAAKKGADKTAEMLSARAGRSSYLNEDSLKGVNDPGAYAVEQVFAALAKG